MIGHQQLDGGLQALPNPVSRLSKALTSHEHSEHRGNRTFCPGTRAVPPLNSPLHLKSIAAHSCAVSFVFMKLLDRIAQYRTPFIVHDPKTGLPTRLSGADEFAGEIAACPTRYVLGDDVVRLCTALAYSKGARTIACADLLHVPAERVWVEWCEGAWLDELRRYGMRAPDDCTAARGRRGALLRSSPDGRRGLIRTFWSAPDSDTGVLASSMEAVFDLDASEEWAIAPSGESDCRAIAVSDAAGGDADILRKCFRFRYERSWADYYQRAALSPAEREAIARHVLGTIAIDVPMLLAFFLLLATRAGLPQRAMHMERLNHSRARAGKFPLCDHTEVFAPLSAYEPSSAESHGQGRRGPRLHHVRGHLVRRGNQLLWRVPHLRGSARWGTVRTRTVTWTFDSPVSAQSVLRASAGAPTARLGAASAMASVIAASSLPVCDD